MVPVLGIPRDKLRKLGMINAFLTDATKDTLCKRCLYILFKPNSLQEFEEFFQDEQEREAPICDDYDYEGGYVVLVYRLPDEYEEDYIKFEQGKYSKFSNKIRKFYPLILRNGDQEVPGLAYRIVTRSEDLIKHWEKEFEVELDPEDEVWEIPNIEKETLKIDKIRSQK